jgi:hypothetical protein
VYVDEIETIWITPPTFDTQGVQITNGTKAQGRHFNIRITNPEVEANWATLWTNTYDANGKIISRKIAGAQAATPNKTEKAWRWQGVEFVDMTTVNTPNRVWLGSV